MNNLGLGDNTSICLYETYGNVHSLNNSAMATLRSVAGPKGTNELKLQHLYTLKNLCRAMSCLLPIFPELLSAM